MKPEGQPAKENNKPRISGLSFPGGILITTPGLRVTARLRGGEIRLKTKHRNKSPLVVLAERTRNRRIPVLGPILGLASLLPSFLTLIFITADILHFTPLQKYLDTTDPSPLILWPSLVFSLLILITLGLFLYLTGPFHAAEHMVVSAQSKGREISVESIATESRVHDSCGMQLLVYAMPIQILLQTLLGDYTLLLFLSMGIAYELRERHVIPPLEGLGRFLQRTVTTRPPKRQHLEVAVACMREFLEESSLAAVPETHEPSTAVESSSVSV